MTSDHRFGISLLAVALLPFLASCVEQAEAPPAGPPPAMPAAVAAPLKEVIASPLELTGRYVATEEVVLRPQVSGRIVDVLIADGSHVQAGDVVMRLEKASLEARVLAAKAAVQRAEAEVVVSQQRLDRSKPLRQKQVLGQQAVDDATAALAVAQAAEKAARADLRAAEVDLGYTDIRAPISGRVGRIVETAGNVVQAGTSHLLTIVADDEIDVVFDLPEREWLRHGERIQSALQGTDAVTVTVFAGDKSGSATLHMVENKVEASSSTVRLYARQSNPGGQLLPGIFARIELHLEEPGEQILVNEKSILAQLNGRFVYTVGEGGVTSIAPVTLGKRHGDLRVVTSGLTGDEQVLLTNVKKIFFPGMPVSPIPGDVRTGRPLGEGEAEQGAAQ